MASKYAGIAQSNILTDQSGDLKPVFPLATNPGYPGFLVQEIWIFKPY